MNDKIRETFAGIQAEEELKEHTKAFLSQKTNGYRRSLFLNPRHVLAVVSCMLILLFGGRWLYFTPTATISIDINPSIELGINRFDRVISVESYNDDGETWMESLDIRNMDYNEAVRQILADEHLLLLLSDDALLSITVIGSDEAQSSEILSGMQSCTAGKKNTYCYSAHAEDVEEAHALGLSYGKYRAFSELQALDPEITAEEVQNMTMREIRDRIALLSQEAESGSPQKGNRQQSPHGCGNGRRRHGASSVS